MNDSCQIVAGSELKSLHRFRRVWYWGWIISGILSLSLIWSLGKISNYNQTLADLRSALTQVHEVQGEQKVITDNYESAVQHQERVTETLTTWWSYVQERNQIAATNRGMVSTARRPE